MRLLSFLTTLVLFLGLFLGKVEAISEGSSNNIFGIHIIDEADLEDAARLVNSNGGEWGYVTIVISETGRDSQKWQRIFDKMRELKLIPIVRLATKPAGAVWEKPSVQDAQQWVDFLGGLNWVVKDRYVVLFNEPNHAQEWGGQINPQEYAQIAKGFGNKLKQKSSDFFVLPAGFDASAPNSSETMEVSLFWNWMQAAEPGIFRLFDGWSSHSYPNPAFSASPGNSGKGSIRSFAWEVSYLNKYGLRQGVPIFITETGWIHKEGKQEKVLGYNSETVGKFFQEAFSSVWTDKHIRAVTPFVLNYQDQPFDYFSWKKPGSSEYYPQFAMVESLPKVKGEPEQLHAASLQEHKVPDKLITSSVYKLSIKFKNNGQSIWTETGGFSPYVSFNSTKADVDSFYIKRALPGQTSNLELDIRTPSTPGTYELSVQLGYKDKLFGDRMTRAVQVFPPPRLKVQARSFFKSVDGQDLKLLIYTDTDVIKEFNNFEINQNMGSVQELRDVTPGKLYRFVLIKPYHVPVQTDAVIDETETVIYFPLMLPLDLNNDGQFSWRDLPALF